MERVTKDELKEMILHGLATDVFIAERAYVMFKSLGEKSHIVNGKDCYAFFSVAQEAFKDQFLLAISRLFDSPSSRNKTRCIEGALDFMSKNICRLPKINERSELLQVMKESNFNTATLNLLTQQNNDEKIASGIVEHFKGQLNLSKNQSHLLKLREIRDKRLAHNEFVKSSPLKLEETIDIVTFRGLMQLVEIVKTFLSVIGWAYLNMVFIINGEYHLSESAERPVHSFFALLRQIENSN